MSMMQMMMGGTSGVTALFTGSLTSGFFTSGPSSGNGYSPANSAGTLTPSTFTALGRTLTIVSAFDLIIAGPNYQSRIDINGFDPLVDPGFAFLYSAQWGINPEFVYTRGATGYSWSSGAASWTFSVTSTPNFNFAAGGTANLVLRG